MGNHKKPKYNNEGGMYNQEENNRLADHLESYVEAISSLFILEGRTEEEVNDAIKTVKKACKNLREGKPEKVFDEERYYQYMMEEENE